MDEPYGCREPWEWEWERPEQRPRDPAPRTADRAECCADRVRFLAEIPRTSRQGRGKIVAARAVRVRLCAWHANILASSDPTVRIHALGER